MWALKHRGRALDQTDPDRDEAALADELGGGHQPVCEFPPAERERDVELRKVRIDRRAAVAVDSARQVDRDAQRVVPS